MVVDPMFYKKHSGRSGDPYDRLGAALAQSDKRKADRDSEMHNLKMAANMPAQWRVWFLNPKMALLLVLVGIVVAVVVAATR
jgi:hypothetical protein